MSNIVIFFTVMCAVITFIFFLGLFNQLSLEEPITGAAMVCMIVVAFILVMKL